MHYAQINADGICFALSELAAPVDAPNLIPRDAGDSGMLGKRWTGAAWESVPEPAPAPTPRHISVGAFFDRFGPQKINILASADPIAQALVKDASVRRYIDLDRSDLPAALQLLVGAGFLIDPAAIVGEPVQPHELP